MRQPKTTNFPISGPIHKEQEEEIWELNCFPDLKLFSASIQAAPWATHTPISCPLDLDCINPMVILSTLQNEKHFFLLESATAEKTIARYSFFAYRMERRFRCMTTPEGNAELWLTDFRRQGQERRLDPDCSQNLFELLFQQCNWGQGLALTFQQFHPCPQMARFSGRAGRHVQLRGRAAYGGTASAAAPA